MSVSIPACIERKTLGLKAAKIFLIETTSGSLKALSPPYV